MEDEQMIDGEQSSVEFLNSPPASDISSISDVSDINEQNPIIYWNLIVNETRKIPESSGINTPNRVVKLHRHVKKGDVKSKKMSSKFDRILDEFKTVTTRLDTVTTRLDTVTTRLDTVTTRLDTVITRLDTLITNNERDRKSDKAKSYSQQNKLYNMLLKGDDAKLHNLVIVESDDIAQIGNSIPNGPDRIQDIKDLSRVDAEQILKYLGFQNLDHLQGSLLLLQNEVRRQYGLA